MAQRPRKKSRRRITGRVLLVLLALLVIFIVFDFDWSGPGKPPPTQTLEYDGHTWQITPIEFFRSRGLDVQEIPPEENAALDYRVAAEMLPGFPRHWGKEARQRLGNEGDYVLRYCWPDDCALLWSQLSAAQPALERARLGLGKEQAQGTHWMRRNDLLIDMLMLHLGRTRATGEWFIRAGKVAQASGHHKEARDDFLAAVAMGNHMAQDPFLPSGLVGARLNQMGFDALARWILCDPPAPLLREALDTIRALEPDRPNFDRALRTERIVFLDLIRALGKLKEYGLTSEGGVGRLVGRSRTLRRIVRAKANGLFDRLEEWNTLAGCAKYTALPDLKDAIGRAVRDSFAAGPAMFCSRLPAHAVTYAHNDVRWAAIKVRIALALYKAEHGDYPRKLDGIEPYLGEIPLDPFTEEPFRYRREDDEYVFYSVGPDLKDDGGTKHAETVAIVDGSGLSRQVRWEYHDYVFTSRLEEPPPFEEYLKHDGRRPAGGWSTERHAEE